MEFLQNLFNRAKTYIVVISMQVCIAGLDILTKKAFDHGLSPHVLVAYRMLVAAIIIAPFAFFLERTSRPKMTLSIFAKILLLTLLDPILGQNLFFTGMKYTTPDFVVALCNLLPAMTFIMACIFRFEKVSIKKLHSQAKILGTVMTVGGAMVMTLLKGNTIKTNHKSNISASGTHEQNHIMGAVMITIACFFWSCFFILQANILKTYPSELSLAALVCIVSSVEAVILAFSIERGNIEVWTIHYDVKLLAVLCGGIVGCTCYFIMGWLIKKRGPVFGTAFNPFGMVVLAILSSIFLAEDMYQARIVGAVIIVTGLYLVLWGKSIDKDDQSIISENNEEVIEAHREMATIDFDIKAPNSSIDTTTTRVKI